MSKFIVIEGIEGSGKSTLLQGLQQTLREQKPTAEILCTREPGATHLGKEIRSLVLGSGGTTIDPKAELMLFLADRAQHISEVLQPALARGATIICDRFAYSTLAYQGYGRGMDLSELVQLSDFVLDGLTPDAVLLLDLPAEVGLARAKSRATAGDGESWNRFEDSELAFHNRIRTGFLTLAQEANNPWCVLDAQQSSATLLAESLLFLETLERRDD